jgi:hypothetical protein
MNTENTNKKDDKLIKTVNNRYFYIILSIIVILCTIIDDHVLNEPRSFFLFRIFLALGIVSIFCYLRYVKFKLYYKRKLRDWLTVILFVGVLTFSVFFIQGFLQIPMGLVIRFYAEDSQTEFFDCRIKNVITTGVDKVIFVFMGKRYSRYLNTQGCPRNVLISDYYVKVAARKSLENSYYVESLEILKK